MELAVIQYGKNDRFSSLEVIPFQRVINSSVPADVFARFRVKPDTCDITLEVYKDFWNQTGRGFVCRMGVPYCMTDFFYHYKEKPYMYLLISFCGKRLVFDFLRGDHQSRLLRDSRIKAEDNFEGRIFHREDIPDEARQLCDFVPLDSIDIW
jgi:hypothetical protein